ncbi:unnamed protein product [Ambrosiozyma monospora]|uniref:Unnamed protein product n=1 Tax=Ambrosiozyma monospora TaxID=43982 RepID=A0ACB5T333_AMBMO|nr:unnamed protein product [Ambrosiozyma monospora]
MEGIQIDCTKCWYKPEISYSQREVVNLPSDFNGLLEPLKTDGNLDLDSIENQLPNTRDYNIVIEGRIAVASSGNSKVDPDTGSITFVGVIEFDHTKTIKLTTVLLSFKEKGFASVEKLCIQQLVTNIMIVSDSLSNISDPTDWESTTFPQLAGLDSLLRCHICKEFLKAPVLTTCDHIFCSVCIRRSLSTEKRCPLCSEPAYESGLKKVLLVDEICLWFSNNRAELMEKLRVKPIQPEERIVEQNDPVQEPRSDDDILITAEHERTDKRKYEEEDDDDDEDLDIIEVSGINFPQLRKSQTPTSEGNKKQKVEASDMTSGGSVDRIMVECPVCLKSMTLGELQGSHIDRCLQGDSSSPRKQPPSSASFSSSFGSFGRPQSRSKTATGSISSFFSPVRKPAARASTMHTSSSNGKTRTEALKNRKPQLQPESIKYKQRLPNLDPSLGTSKLKEKLQSFGLTTHGTRAQLETRLKEYISLYNANLDSVNPVNERVLKSKLSQWEYLQNKQPSSSHAGSDRDSDHQEEKREWNEKYKDDYRSLIAKARANMKKTKVKKSSDEKDEKDDTDVAESDRETENLDSSFANC